MGADPFITQLTNLCREYPTRAKWVFVPTHAVGLTIGDRLAREGTSWVNLRFVTPLDVAVPMAAPFLLERGIDPSEEPLGPPLVMRLLLDLPVEGGYFRPMAEHASMAQALWATLRELRFAGLRADDLPPAGFRSEAKYRELVALAGAYERHLESAGAADMAVVFEEALKHRPSCPIGAGDLRVELPDTVWPPLVRRFLDALPGTLEPASAIDLDTPEPGRVWARAATSPRTRRPAASAGDSAPAPGPSGSRPTQFHLPFADESGSGDDGVTTRDGERAAAFGRRLSIFRAGGHEAEVEEIIRRILVSGRRLDEVEIVCASDTHALVAWEKARRLDWPVTISAGVPAGMTRPGRALHAWGAWIEGGFAAADLRRMFEAGDVAVGQATGDRRQAAGDVTCSAQQAAKILRRAGATWGRDTYAASLAAFADRQEQRASEGGADEAWRRLRAAQARWLAPVLEELLASIPEPGDEGLVAVGPLLDAAEAFVTGCARRAGDLDAAGHLAVLDALANLRPLGPVRGPLSWALRFLTDAVKSARVARSRSKPGHVHVSLFTDPGYDGRPVVFVCGLEEARVFPPVIEDPVLLDRERAAIEHARKGGAETWLRSSGDRMDEAVRAGLARLARLGAAAEEMVLSYSSVDTREFREAFPSWLVLRAWRAACNTPQAGYPALRTAAGEPVSVIPVAPDQASTTAAWWMNAARVGEAAVDAVVAAHPGVGRGIQAIAARESDAFTVFDGYAPEAGRLLDPSRSDMIVSATMLESAADCPFRYFLETGLGIEPIEEEDADADVWLDPLRRGSELHDLYAALLRRSRDANRRVSTRDDLDWFLALGRQRLDDLRREIPPPSEEVAARESAELLEDLRLFVAAEEEQRHIEPVAFEVGFGRPVGEGREPLATPDPVFIDLGGGRRLVVAGRIDRIDRLRPARDGAESARREAGSSASVRYRIVDYKTGRFNPGNYSGVFRRGTLLQHALYGLAAERLLKPVDGRATVQEGVYWHPTSRGWGRHATIPRPSGGDLDRVLTLLCDVLGNGVFLQAPERKENGTKRDACRYCDFRQACGAAPASVAARKTGANAEGRLAPWLALQEVE